METKNMKTKNKESLAEQAKNDFGGKVPSCPLCGNTEMNYYVTSKMVWKCSRAHMHSNSLTIQEPQKNVA